MNRKIFVCLIVLLAALSMPGLAWAESAALNETGMLNVLAALEVMTGDESGSLNLNSPVTRAEFTKMVLAASPYKDTAEAQSAFSPYSDVTRSHWAAGYIKTARDMGLINGYLDGSFKPDNGVKLAEALTVALKNLGYTEGDFAGSYPTGQMSLYHSLQLDEGLSLSDPEAQLTRRDCAYLIYNMLNAKTKAGQTLAQSLGYQLDGGGKIDYLSLLNEKISGPFVVADSGWASQLGFEPATVLRNDAASSASAVQINDVIYYSAGMRTLWVYSKQRTGSYESAQPDRTSPASVVISGVSYSVGSSEAAYALSVLGGHSLGESITVLLGRDDSIVAVLSGSANPSAGASAASGSELCGIVTDTGTKTYTDSSGNAYSSEYIKLLATDGQSYEIPSGKSYNAGTLVKVKNAGGGSGAAISSLSSAAQGSLSGTVNAEATRLGNRQLASNVEILDIYKTAAAPVQVIGKRLHQSRLAGARLAEGDVLYWEQDGDGYISKLILNNASGDLYSYGILQTVSENVGSGSYIYVSNGTVQSVSSPNISYNVNKGPCAVLSIGGGILAMRNLSGVSVAAITGSNTLTDTGGQGWLLADNAQVYISRDGEFYQTSLRLLSLQEYSLRAYYDQSASQGGRIRIIVASPL